jgi:hypothetical protein
LDKICIPILLLGYTLLQSIMVIYVRFARKRIITLFFILSTWSLLCDGQRRVGAVVPFQSPVRHGDTVVGLTSGIGNELLRFRPSEQNRPECSRTEKNWLYKDGLKFNGFSSYHPDTLFHSNSSLQRYLEVEAMSSSEQEESQDGYVRSSIKSVIKAFSGAGIGTPLNADPPADAEEADRISTDPSLSEKLVILPDDAQLRSDGILKPSGGSSMSEEILLESNGQKGLSAKSSNLLADCDMESDVFTSTTPDLISGFRSAGRSSQFGPGPGYHPSRSLVSKTFQWGEARRYDGQGCFRF